MTGAGEAARFERLREEVLALYPPLLAAAGAAGAEETARRLTAGRERLAAGRLTAVLAGEFKRGKSTLLNALLRDPRLLPADTVVTTRLVTTVEYGPAELIEVVVEGDGGQLERLPIARESIKDYVSEQGNPGNERRAVLMEIRTPNPALRAGVRWADTPGVGGVHDEHTWITTQFLAQADALLFVADVTNPLTGSELAFLRTAATAGRIAEREDGLIFALTKVDLVGDYRPQLEDVRSKAAAALGRKPETIDVVPVSAQAHLRFLESGSELDREVGNVAELEAVLWRTLHRRRVVLLAGGALSDLDAAVRVLIAPVETAIGALRRDSARETAALREEIVRRRESLAGLRAGAHGWRTELAGEIAEVVALLRRRAAAGLDEVWQRAETGYLDDPDLLIDRLGTDLAVVLEALDELAGREAARVVEKLAGGSELRLTLPRLAGLPAPPLPVLAPPGTAGPAGRRAPAAAVSFGSTSAAFAGAFGTAVGALIGSVVPGPGTVFGAQVGGYVAGALGALAGGAHAWRQAVAQARVQEREARRATLRAELGRLRGVQREQLGAALADLGGSLERRLGAELESRIDRELEGARQAIDRLRERSEETAEQAGRRLAALHDEHAPLDRVRTAVLGLAARVAETDR